MSSSKTHPILLAIFLCLSLIPVLGLPQISGSSEAREAHVAYIIRASNEWILPNRNGYVPSKPLLHHWLTVFSSYATGAVDEFSSRLPSALLGIFTLTALFVFSRRLFKLYYRSDELGEFYAFLSTFVLATTYGFFRMLSLSMVDMTFASFCVFAMLAMLLPAFQQVLESRESIRISQRSWALFFLFCGLATLAKGPLGIVLPGLIFGVILCNLIGVKKALLLAFKPRWPWLIYPVLAFSWYFLAQQKAQSSFVERQLLFENVKRFFGGDNINSEPVWFYLPSFLAKAAPWSFLFIVLVLWLLRSRQPRSAARQISFALLTGIASAFVFFSISSGKRHSYLQPIFPLIAFAGVWIYAQWFSTLTVLQKEKNRHGIGLVLNIFVFLLILVGLVSFLVGVTGEGFFSDKPEVVLATQWLSTNARLLAFAPLLSLIVLIVLIRSKAGDIMLLWARLFVICAFFSSILTALAGIKGAYRDYPEMARLIEQNSKGRELVAVRTRFDELLDPVFFYLGNAVRVLDPKDLSKACAKDILFITRHSNLKEFDQAIKIREEIVLKEKVGSPRGVEERAVSLFQCETQ